MKLLYILSLLALLCLGVQRWRKRAASLVLGVSRGSQIRTPPSLIGARGTAQETFVENGKVFVLGEIWQAESERGIIEKGGAIEVTELLPGLKLRVKGGGE